MLAPQITNHVAAALARCMQQYISIPPQYALPLYSQNGATIDVSLFTGILSTFVDQIQLLENAIYALDGERQYYNGTTFPAFGAQLDGIGQLVNLPRNGLSDAQYLIFITGTIAENFSNTTMPEMLNIVTLLFQVAAVIAVELFPAAVAFEVPDTTPLSPALFATVARMIQASLGAGIGLEFLATYPATTPTSVFRFGTITQSFGGGFGDVTNPLIGGGYASAVYTNVGS